MVHYHEENNPPLGLFLLFLFFDEVSLGCLFSRAKSSWTNPFNLFTKVMNVPDDIWEYDAVNQIVLIKDKKAWDRLAGRLNPKGGQRRHQEFKRDMIAEKIRQMKEEPRLGVRNRSSPGELSLKKVARTIDLDSSQ